MMPWAALLMSALALLLSVALARNQAKSGVEELARHQKAAAVLSQECDHLQSNLAVLRTAFSAYKEILARRDSSVTADEEDFFEVNPRVVRFIDLQRAWEKKTGQKLRGAAIADGRTIEELTGPDSRQKNAEEAELMFVVAARRVVEYLVQASGTAGGMVDEEQVGKLLEEMAELAELELIDPPRGQRPDRRLHDSVGTVQAGVDHRGTIAKVEVRGLVRGNGSVMKAKVYLYD